MSIQLVEGTPTEVVKEVGPAKVKTNTKGLIEKLDLNLLKFKPLVLAIARSSHWDERFAKWRQYKQDFTLQDRTENDIIIFQYVTNEPHYYGSSTTEWGVKSVTTCNEVLTGDFYNSVLPWMVGET